MSGNHRKVRGGILICDLAWVGCSIVLAWLIRYGFVWEAIPRPTANAFGLTVLESCLIWSVLCVSVDLTGSEVGWRTPAIFSHLVLAVSTLMLILLASAYLGRIYFSRLALGCFGTLSLSGFLVIRLAARAILDARNHSAIVRRLVIVGSGIVAMETAARFSQHPELGCRIVGFLAPEDASLGILHRELVTAEPQIPMGKVIDSLRSRGVDELVFATSGNGDQRINGLMDECVRQGFAVNVIPQPYELYLSAPELLDLDGIPILRLRNSMKEVKGRAWKRAMDLSLAIPLLLISAPVVFLAALALRIRRERAFCREERYGLNGRRFWIYRLNLPRRSTGLPAYEQLLQHLSVTELPQLWNVLRGDMSLVGPRPEGLDRVRHYSDWHRQRLNVKPGMTGLAQVNGLRDEHELEDKTRYDLQYILHRSLFQDCSLLLQTFWTLAGRLRRLGELTRRPAASMQEHPTSKSLVA
ncbi:MAG TPA: sugar transferase [Candidatus Acidoferrales bacterium]|nr:sugar transferase [Candidatus Acidoferrales bacterium]